MLYGVVGLLWVTWVLFCFCRLVDDGVGFLSEGLVVSVIWGLFCCRGLVDDGVGIICTPQFAILRRFLPLQIHSPLLNYVPFVYMVCWGFIGELVGQSNRCCGSG